MQQCFAIFTVHLLQEEFLGVLFFIHLGGAVYALCRAELLFILHTSASCFSAWMIQYMVANTASVFSHQWIGKRYFLLKNDTIPKVKRMLFSCRKHFFISPPLPPSLSDLLCQAYVCVASCRSSLQLSTTYRHTHELKQLPWRWQSHYLLPLHPLLLMTFQKHRNSLLCLRMWEEERQEEAHM